MSFTTSNAGRTDHLAVEDLPGGVGDTFNVAPGVAGGVGGGATGTVQVLRSAPNSTPITLNLVLPGVSVLELDGLTGSDTFNVLGSSGPNVVPFSNLIINDGTTVNLTGATSPVAVTMGDNTPNSLNPNTVITGYGAPVTLIGVDTANLDANTQTVTATGTSRNDDFIFTPTGALAGTFYDTIASGNNLVPNTVFNVANAKAGTSLTFDGGSAGNADEVTVQGSDANDLFEINQGGRTAQVLANDNPANALWPAVLNANVAILTADGLGGVNTFQVEPGTTPATDTLLVNVDGSATGSFNQLTIGSSFQTTPGTPMGTLGATQLAVVNRNLVANSGTVWFSPPP